MCENKVYCPSIAMVLKYHYSNKQYTSQKPGKQYFWGIHLTTYPTFSNQGTRSNSMTIYWSYLFMPYKMCVTFFMLSKRAV